jgi:hypothetical protein
MPDLSECRLVGEQRPGLNQGQQQKLFARASEFEELNVPFFDDLFVSLDRSTKNLTKCDFAR